MAFGNAVTDVSQASVGTYGYTVRVDTTGLYAFEIKFVQAQDDSGATPVMGEPSQASESLKAIQEYLEADNSPNIAFNYTHGITTIFFKTSVYPYVADTRFACFGVRDAIKMVNDNDRADFPDQDIDLFTAYAIRHACIIKDKPIPSDVARLIQKKEYEIKQGG